MGEAADGLGAVEVAEGDVVELRGKIACGEGTEAADVDLPLAFAGGGSEGGKVASGDGGEATRFPWLGGGGGGAVALAEALVELGADGFGALAGLAPAEVAFAKEGNGGDDKAGGLGVGEEDEGLFARGEGGDDFAVHPAQEVARGFELGGRVVVTTEDDDGAAGGGFGEGGKEVVVEADDGLRGGCGIENVARDEEGVCTGGAEGVGKPGEEVAVLGGAVELAKGLAEVPVGSVQEAEGVGGLWRGGGAHGAREDEG